MNPMILTRTALLSVLLAALGALSVAPLAGCDGGAGAAAPAVTSDDGRYRPFSASNLQNQLLRVGAHAEINALRKGDGFGAGAFGGSCEAWSPEASTPTDPTQIGSLYIETASLAAKVSGRQDDHAYAAGEAIGEALHARICGAIAAGSAASQAAPEATEGTAWQAQIVDKSLQHFFYLSVFHEMTQGARAKWDEAVGYYGMSLDGSQADGIAATAASRDKNCGTTYAKDIFGLLVLGKDRLDAALTAAGHDGAEASLEALPADLREVIEAVDAKLLEVFAISMAREFIALRAGEDPAIKLIEGRSFFWVLEPFLLSVDPTLAAAMRAEVTKADPSEVDATLLIDAVKTVWGLDVAALCQS
jgi:hypothetical protein